VLHGVLSYGWMKLLKDLMYFAITAIVLVIGGGILFPAIMLFFEGIPEEYVDFINFTVAAVVLVAVCFVLIKNIMIRREDWIRLKEAMSVFSSDRHVIANNFLAFNLHSSRLKYVKWIEINSGNYFSDFYDSKNVWPNKERPNINNDKASTLLAQLDAKWLKLDV